MHFLSILMKNVYISIHLHCIKDTHETAEKEKERDRSDGGPGDW
jgi:hypothetical protein